MIQYFAINTVEETKRLDRELGNRAVLYEVIPWA